VSLVRVRGRATGHRLAGAARPDTTATGGPGPQLTWAPPALTNPLRLVVTRRNNFLDLDNSRDYILDCRTEVFDRQVNIKGGRRVVLIGGEWYLDPADPRGRDTGIGLRDQPAGAVVHLEGLKITGRPVDGIFIKQPNAVTVQIQNYYCNGPGTADEASGWPGLHPDLIQMSDFPGGTLRIDRLTGVAAYQGIFLEPDDNGLAVPAGVDIRNVDITTRPTVGGIKTRLYLSDGVVYPWSVQNFYIQYDTGDVAPIFDPSRTPALQMDFPGVTLGLAPTPMVDPNLVGINYRSPGYL